LQDILPEGDGQTNQAETTATQHQDHYDDNKPGTGLLAGGGERGRGAPMVSAMSINYQPYFWVKDSSDIVRMMMPSMKESINGT